MNQFIESSSPKRLKKLVLTLPHKEVFNSLLSPEVTPENMFKVLGSIKTGKSDTEIKLDEYKDKCKDVKKPIEDLRNFYQETILKLREFIHNADNHIQEHYANFTFDPPSVVLNECVIQQREEICIQLSEFEQNLNSLNIVLQIIG